MYGLYDIDGILRFTCSDREACIDYAELLGIALEDYSLMDLQSSSPLEFKAHLMKGHHQARNSN